MRIVFLGTPDFGVPSLEALVKAGYEVVGVFTQPDKPKGRGKQVQFSPVKECAMKLGIPVYQPAKIRLDGLEDLRALKPDLCVTAAFGQILSQEVLDVPTIGTVNVHSSLLPKYRGSAPVNWAVLQGETKTGVTTMMTDKGLDTGDILLTREVDILPDETAGELIDRLAPIGAELLIETIGLLAAGNCPRRKQDESQMSYFPMLKKEMGLMDWRLTAHALQCRVRGLSPWPGCYTMIGGETMKIWKTRECAGENGVQPGTFLSAAPQKGLVVQTGEGALEILELQAQGGKRMRAADYLRGHPLTATACDPQEEESHE